MVKALAHTFANAAATLVLLAIIFEGPTLTAIVRDKLKRA
jgi:hypothetical protein